VFGSMQNLPRHFLDLYQGTWAGTLTVEETTDAFTDQLFLHKSQVGGVDGYTER